MGKNIQALKKSKEGKKKISRKTLREGLVSKQNPSVNVEML